MDESNADEVSEDFITISAGRADDVSAFADPSVQTSHLQSHLLSELEAHLGAAVDEIVASHGHEDARGAQSPVTSVSDAVEHLKSSAAFSNAIESSRATLSSAQGLAEPKLRQQRRLSDAHSADSEEAGAASAKKAPRLDDWGCFLNQLCSDSLSPRVDVEAQLEALEAGLAAGTEGLESSVGTMKALGSVG